MPIVLIHRTSSPRSACAIDNSMHEITNYPDWCTCPVSNDIMEDPVIVDAPCLHTVNRSTLDKWKDHGTCPLCSTPFRSMDGIFSSPNVPLREAIQEFFRTSHNRIQRKISLHNWTLAQKQLGVQRCSLHPDQPSHECLSCIWKDYNIHENDTVDGIVGTMRQHPSDKRIVEQGCRVLANRLSAKEVGMKTELSQQYFLVFVFNTMKEHKHAPTLIHQAFRVLRYLPFWNEEHAKTIAEEGGTTAMLEILRLHEDQPNVQRYGCWFLYGLCKHYNPSVERIQSNGGLDLVQRIIRNHEGNEDVQTEAKRLNDFLQHHVEC